MFSSKVEVLRQWQPLMDEFFASEDGQKLFGELKKQQEKGVVIYPPDPLRLFKLVAPEDVKVVIIGQDPYHGRGQANGLAFSVTSEVKLPPSLKNIFAEIKAEYPQATFSSGALEGWVRQGVALLNSILTVEESRPASHRKLGWETLTDRIILELACEQIPKVFMLWGSFAQEKEGIIRQVNSNHLILKSNHPSPLSARRGPIPFLGNGHFRKANEWLVSKGLVPIDWGC